MKNKIYLDYASTTPVDKQVLKETCFCLERNFGNPASIHSFGQKAKQILETSRSIVANALNAKANEIIFTSSATESNNLALKGVAFANKEKGNHIIISSIEHDCIFNSAKWLEKNGFDITYLNVDKYGLVNPKDIINAITKNTILVSVMHANNEIGTIEPIQEIGKICKQKNVYFHTDAAQSFGKIPIDVNKFNIDLLTASSHKMYGPKGAGCLFVRNNVNIHPILHGGGQESGLRSSSVNVPAILGFAKAVEVSYKSMKSESSRLAQLRDMLINGVLENIPEAYLNGHKKQRLPNNANFWFKSVEGESIAVMLDLAGIAVSTGSACSSAKLEPSRVLLAIGLAPEQAHGSIRITLGKYTTKKHIEYVLEVMPNIIKKLRKISPF